MLKDNRFTLMMSDDEILELEDYRFANRITSRAKAMRKLMREALDAHYQREGLALSNAGGVPAITTNYTGDEE